MTDLDYIREENKTLDDKKFNWEDIATGGYSALNSALFGIPDVLVKAASSDAYKKLQEMRERNKATGVIGDIAGAFVPTGGLLAKGVGTAAKLGARGLQAAKLAKAAGAAAKVGQAADTAADIIKGTKAVKGVSGAMGRGVLAAGEQVLPRIVTGEADLGEIGLSGALGAATGALGYGLGKGLQRLPEKIEDMKKWADKTILKRANITDKVMRTQKAYMGGDISKYYAELADLAEARELHRGPELDKMVAEIKDTWRKMGDAFDATDLKIDIQKIIDVPDVAQAVKRDVGLVDKIDDILTKTEATDGFVNKRAYLNELLYDQSGKVSVDEKKIAKSILDQIEETAEKLTGLDIGDAKTAWKLMKPFEAADKLDDMRVAAGGLAGGSDTAFKLGLAGLGAGSGIAGLNEVKDDPSNPQAWIKLLAAGVFGGSLSAGAREKVGIALAKAIRKMPTDKIAQMVQDVADGKLAKVLAKIPKEDLPVAASKFFVGKLGDEVEDITSVEAPATAEMPGTEEAQKEEIVEVAEEQPEAYMEALNERMMAYWAENFAETMDFNEYVAAVKEATNGFDPRSTVNFFFSDKKERQKFLTDLEVAGKFKGVDVESLMKGPGLVEGVLEPGQAAAKKLKKNEFIDTIAKLVTSEGSLPSKATKDTIQADVSAILALDATPEEKKELILNKLEEKYGLGYSTLRQLGLA